MLSIVSVGFTGSRHPMFAPTKRMLDHVLKQTKIDLVQQGSSHVFFRHGDCINCDDTAAQTASALGYVVHAHPPFNESLRAFSEVNDVIHAPKDFISRNHDIVDLSRIMIATPHTMKEIIRSGTWATIRYARKLDRELCIIFPDGSVEWENSARTYGREAS